MAYQEGHRIFGKIVHNLFETNMIHSRIFVLILNGISSDATSKSKSSNIMANEANTLQSLDSLEELAETIIKIREV